MAGAIVKVDNLDEIIEFLNAEKLCRVGIMDGGDVKVVPMFYCFKNEGKVITFYLYCSRREHKEDIIKTNPKVAIEIDGSYEAPSDTGEEASEFYHMSFMANGRVFLVESMEEKEEALNLMLKHHVGRKVKIFNEVMVEPLCLCKLTLSEYTVNKL